MNNDLFLAILALDSYSRGYGATLANLSDSAGVRIGNAIIKKNSSVLEAVSKGVERLRFL